ncbi:MAG: hypothetical protein ACKO0M_12020 [Cyanobium sp.]
MTSADPNPAPPTPSASAGLLSLVARRPLLALAGTFVLSEALGRSIHLDGGAVLGLGALAGGWWLLARRRPQLSAQLPGDPQGWIRRCHEVLPRFVQLARRLGRSCSVSGAPSWRPRSRSSGAWIWPPPW